MTKSNNPALEECLEAFRVTKAFNDCMTFFPRPRQLSLLEMMILMTIHESEDPIINKRTLRDALPVYSSNMHYNTKNLQEKGLLQQIDRYDDKRFNTLVLTDEGIKIMPCIYDYFNKIANKTMKVIEKEKSAAANDQSHQTPRP